MLFNSPPQLLRSNIVLPFNCILDKIERKIQLLVLSFYMGHPVKKNLTSLLRLLSDPQTCLIGVITLITYYHYHENNNVISYQVSLSLRYLVRTIC